MAQVPVVARIRAKPGRETEAERLLTSLLPLTHKEQGCELYALHRVAQDPRMFIFVEKWANPESLQAHLASAHIAAAMQRREELFESIEILSLEGISAGNEAKIKF